VHVLVAWMNLLIYIEMAISSMLFSLTKHHFLKLFSKTSVETIEESNLSTSLGR
jgi:hypothetical protein